VVALILPMKPPVPNRRTVLQLLAALGALPVNAFPRPSRAQSRGGPRTAGDGQHVHPGSNIQDALEAAAKDPDNKRVIVHAGTYRPKAKGQALIWFNARHDGITLEAEGDVTLTAANPDIADRKAPSHPAVVNHVVYFGDGISRKTVMRGFRITGANNFTTGSGDRSPIESDDVRKTPFFFADGGGIKIYARSYPTIEQVEVVDNYTSPCGGGVSVEHLDQLQDSVLFRDCVFRNNRTQITGSAVDVLHGSRATLENCLFTGNVANLGVDYVGMLSGGEYHTQNGSGALTVFARSRVAVTRCTFTGNWNGVDDDGTGSTYVDSIFWKNTLAGGISEGGRYEIDIVDAAGVRGSFIHGDINDLRRTIDSKANRFDPPDPRFDAAYVPQAPEYAKVGYRPAARVKPSA
jgi:parallel beta helix pectate lyase-like protein